MLTFNEEKRIKNLKILLQRTPETLPTLQNEMKNEIRRIKYNKTDKKFSGVQEV